MYRSFNLTLEEDDLSDILAYSWTSNPMKDRARDDLLKHLQNGQLDAEAMENDWFGSVSANVFISHSHADLALATKLAKLLEDELNLTPFIDSHVWGYADDLLRTIDDEFCMSDDRRTYNYQKRNRSTSHVHLMLAAALTKMIDKCEMVIFLNTENSILPKKFAKDSESTSSPWIYSELNATKFLRKRYPLRVGLENHQAKRAAQDTVIAESLPVFSYAAPLAHLTPISAKEFCSWRRLNLKGNESLDYLYSKFPER